MLFLASLPYPFFRGTVHINPTSSPPVIGPYYLFRPQDVEVLARHIQYIETTVSTEPLASLVKKGCRRLPAGMDISTLDVAEEHCRRNLVSNMHP